MEKRVCHAKIVVNPQACKSFSLRYELYPKQDIYLKIMLQNVGDLTSVVDELKKQVNVRYDYTVQFNLKNVPPAIKDNKKIQEDIIDHFKLGKSPVIVAEKLTIPEAELTILASDLKERIKTYGANPDLNNVYTSKGKQKIFNYVKTNLARPNLNLDDALAIAKLAVA